MPIEPDELVRQFGLALESRNAALFVGAGLSTDAGIPGWSKLLKPLRESAKIPESLEDMPLLAQYIVAAVPGGRATLEAGILRSVASAENAPSEGHGLIARMPLEEIWTTNYDRLLETAMPDARLIVTENDLLDRRTHTSRRVIKMHGSVNEERTDWSRPPVITRSDYEEYQNSSPRMWSALQATYLTRSTLFLGFSFADPNIEVLLRLSRAMPNSSVREHFTVMRRPSEPDKFQLHTHRVIDLERSGVAVCEVDNYDELIPILRSLERRAREQFLFVSGSLPEGDDTAKSIARQLGSSFASSSVSVVSLAGAAATEFSFALGQALKATSSYEPGRLRYFFRQTNETAPVMHKRIGTAIYSDLDTDELRKAVITSARAALIMSGGSGTMKEIEMCVDAALPVVPLAITGGAAADWWRDSDPSRANLVDDAESQRDWALLGGEDVEIALLAARRLLDRAMYLDHSMTVSAGR